MASTGGNLLQRTRCFYFYDVATPCNKRAARQRLLRHRRASTASMRSSAPARRASRRIRPTCAWRSPRSKPRSTSPGRAASRAIAFADFHRLPGDTPQIDNNLRRDEIITAIELPAQGFAANYSYLKIRDRLSYAFALVSVAAALELDGGRIKEARLALGGVAHKPWRNPAAEAALRGKPAGRRGVRAGGRCAAARRQRLRAQRLQDRTGAPRHRAGADAGRERHAAIAVRQENPMSADLNRRDVLAGTIALGALGTH